MTNSIFTTISALALTSVVTFAVTPASSQVRPSPPPATQPVPAPVDPKEVHVTGCLKAWEGVMAGTAGAPGAAATMDGQFLLTGAETDAAAGTPATTPPGEKRFIVRGDTGVNLVAHVNHQVRLTGKFADMSGHAMSAKKDEAKPAMPAEMTLATITVSAVTMINAACSAASQ